jgi:hypothetical protein
MATFGNVHRAVGKGASAQRIKVAHSTLAVVDSVAKVVFIARQVYQARQLPRSRPECITTKEKFLVIVKNWGAQGACAASIRAPF